MFVYDYVSSYHQCVRCACCISQAMSGVWRRSSTASVRRGALRGHRLAGIHLHPEDSTTCSAFRWEAQVPQHRPCSASWDICGEVFILLYFRIIKRLMLCYLSRIQCNFVRMFNNFHQKCSCCRKEAELFSQVYLHSLATYTKYICII